MTAVVDAGHWPTGTAGEREWPKAALIRRSVHVAELRFQPDPIRISTCGRYKQTW